MFGKGKFRSLDAICAKLKSAGENEVESGVKSTILTVNEIQNKTNSSENNNGDNKAILDNCVSCDLEKTEDGESEVQSSKTVEIQQVDNEKSPGSSRRKRKATTPRNISEVREKFDKIDESDELAEYEINNQNTDFPPEDDDDLNSSNNSAESGKENVYTRKTEELNDSVPQIKKIESIDTKTPDTPTSTCTDSPVTNSIHESLKTNDRKHARKPRKPVPSFNGCGSPLDLSTSSKETSYQNSITEEDPTVDDVDDDDVESDGEHDEKAKMNESEKAKCANIEISNLMDFAENTMNELLSIYGLNGVSDSVTRQVPNKCFSTNQILKGQVQGRVMPPAKPEGEAPPIISLPSKDNTSPESVSLVAEKKGINTNYLTTTTKFKGQSSDGLKDDKFINSAAYIKAVFNKQPGDTTPTKSPGLPDYSKYLKRFSSGVECKVKYCKELGYREHFHCMDCNFRVFVKKEEMVRHFKWHRKREESLQHGFMRYSPMDDCSVKFGACTHNGRQTHYHCLQMGCDKVYISTSDVQMHANYHRKDSAIIQEGFQRFRATEDCGTQSCAFYGQRTTHFHCRRTGCNFTFKNKADMEKHKTYHQKDEVLARDGFKKFMKYEHCGYMGCRYSKLSNHIHCIRPGCLYVLHSTAQLFSHKRKHERRDFETAYRKYREESSEDSWMLSSASGLSLVNPMSLAPKPSHGSMSLPVSVKSESMQGDESCDSKLHSFDENSNSDVRSLDSENSASFHMDADTSCNGDSSINDTSLLSNHGNGIEGEKLNDSLTLPIPKYGDGRRKNKETDDATREETSNNTHDNIPITQTHSSALAHHLQSPTQPGLLNKPMATPSPAHAQSQPSNFFLSSPTQASFPLPARPPPVNLEKRERDESWKNYLLRFTANDPCNSRCQYLYKDHYHCRVDGCLVLFKSKDGVREHARFHEMQDRITPVAYSTYDKDTACPLNCQYSKKEKHYHCIWSGCTHVVPHHGPTFGRLEHYRIHEDARASIGKSYKYNMKASEDAPRRRGRPPKYPKNEIPVIPKVELSETEIEKSIEGTVDPSVINGFKKFAENEPCPDELCIFRMREHYHCARPRCHQATDRLDVLNLHAKDFHSFVTILEGFEFFDRNINCRRLHCHNNKANRHFHCVRPKCDYSFVRHSTMIQHNKRHEASTESENSVTAKNSEKELVKTEPATPPTQKLMPVIPPNLHSPSIDAKGMIKTSGIYFPLSGLTGQSKVQPPVVAALPGATSGIASCLAAGTVSTSVIPSSIATSLTTSQQGHIPIVSTPAGSPLTASPLLGTTLLNSTPPGIANPRQLPLTLLLQQGGNSFPQPSWIELCARMHYKQSDHCGRPFCKLKKKDHYHCFECNQAFSDESRIRAHVGKHGLKFSKLDLSVPSLNLLYSPTASPHVPIAPKQIESPAAKDKEGPELSALSNMSEESNTDDDELNASDSLNLNPSTFSNMIAKAQKAHGAQGLEKEFDPDDSLDGKLVINDGENAMADSENSMDLGQDGMTEKETDLSKHSGRKRIRTKHFDYVDSNPVIKQRKVTTGAITTNPKSPKSKAGGFRGPRDDSIPDGYIKVRHKDQCTYPKCAYNQGVTHFHCTRSDCGYSFSDRSRLIQHTLRHERIDSLTGGEMQQFRMKQDCERDDCEYKGKASHFHCLKCNYCCTDSSKVLTHRKYHSKIKNINSQGFEKYGTTEKCSVGGCQYEMKQTHYHCTKPGCHYAVLGPAQMASHNIKHANDTL